MDVLREKMKKYKILEDLMSNIQQMYLKIENRECRDFKILWKWLKSIGSQYSYILKIKPILRDKVGDGSVEEMIEHLLMQY